MLNMNIFDRETNVKEEEISVMEGCFYVDDKDLFNKQYNVIWRYVKGYCLAFILESDENMQLASYYIALFFKKIGKVSKVKSEKMLISLLKFKLRRLRVIGRKY